MKQKILFYFKHIIQTLAFLLIISLVLDWWRSPTPPHQAAQQVFHTLQQPHLPQTLQQISQNQTAVLYFWGSWCGICRHTSPVIHDLHQDGIPVLGVALRSGSNEQVRQYLAQHQWQFDTLNDEHGHLSQQWQIKVTPTILLIQNGKIVHSTTGLASYWGLKLRIAFSQMAA